MKLALLFLIGAGPLKLGVIVFALSGLIMGLVGGLRKLFMKNKGRFFIYLLVTAVLFAAVALLSNKKVLDNIPLNSFIGFQVILFVLGFLHVYAMRRIFPDLQKKITNFWLELLYTIVITCIALIAFMMVVELYKPEFKYMFLSAGIAFIIPFFIVKLFEYAIAVPVSVYKKWFYPVGQNIKDPKDNELRNPLVISFHFSKDERTNELSNFRLKAPEAMEFGKLFYYFINDYNDRHPEGEISFIDKKNEPYGWIFYRKTWFGLLKHVDFERTIKSNRIKEDTVVICQRA